MVSEKIRNSIDFFLENLKTNMGDAITGLENILADRSLNISDKAEVRDVLIEVLESDYKKYAQKLAVLHDERCQSDPQNQDYRIALVHFFHGALPPQDAVTKIKSELQKASSPSKFEFAAMDSLGRVYMDCKDYKNAIKILESAMSKYGSNYQFLLSCGQSYYYAGDLDKAEEKLSLSMTDGERHLLFNQAALVMRQEAALFRAAIYIRKGKYEDACLMALDAIRTTYNRPIAGAVLELSSILQENPNASSSSYKAIRNLLSQEETEKLDNDRLSDILDKLLELNFKTFRFN